jgi:glycerophosphoryl diester phosphodiesterase
MDLVTELKEYNYTGESETKRMLILSFDKPFPELLKLELLTRYKGLINFGMSKSQYAPELTKQVLFIYKDIL